jgi:hypothetical protein
MAAKEFGMKIARNTGLFVFGFLVALTLSGCFDPVSAGLPGSEPASATTAEIESGQAAGQDPQPFTVTITVGADGRAVAGVGIDFIKNGSILNFMQLIVINKTSRTVHTKTQAWRTDSNNQNATLAVEAIAYGVPYEFLLLMGHNERDYAEETPGGDYQYTDDPPTLLAAGFQEVTITPDNNKVTIIMWPLVVDTVFTTGGTTKNAWVGETQLAAADWNLEWTVLKGNSGNGFEQLIAAQQAIGGGNTLEYQSLKTIVQGTGSSGPAPAPQIAGNKITQNIGQYTVTANATGSANFKLEYVPFGNQANWGGYDKAVWIIRNGVNDEPQNTNTTFADSLPWDGTTNGNGAVAFAVTIGAGAGDNDAISEESLAELLLGDENALPDKVIEALHQRIIDGNMSDLKLGMYLNLYNLTPDGEDRITGDNNQNLRIVIASFNQYKGRMGNDDTNHIKFVFKNSPVQKRMRDIASNYGGYPYVKDGSHGTPLLKEYLEGAFFKGLVATLGGHEDYFYEVKRYITGGSYDTGWEKVPFTAKIFIDTEKEVFGTNTMNTSGTEEDLTQTALYAQGGKTRRIKEEPEPPFGGLRNKHWWVASPHSGSTDLFVFVSSDGDPYVYAANLGINYSFGIAPAFCIK